MAVVVNGDSWASLSVANEYAKLRGVPWSNFVVLNGLSNAEVTDVQKFRDEVLAPTFATLKSRGLWGQIDCVAYSVDLPYAAVVSADMSGRTIPQVITPVASANGLTYLHEWVVKKDPDYLRLDINRYARRLLPLPTGTPLSSEEQAEYGRAMGLYDKKEYMPAAVALSKLLRIPRTDPNIGYNLSCCFSLAGRLDEAVGALQKAVAAGYRNAGQATSDPDLKPLAGRSDFQALVAQMRSAKVEMQPGTGFRSRSGWSEAGVSGESGPHYMLSTFLGVTCGRGNSVMEVLECLRRSLKADGTAPKGTVYYLKNGDVRSTTREWGFAPAVAALKSVGVAGAVEDGVLPRGHADVAGAMIGIADFDWASSQSKMVPGAIAEHLTSLGGIISERGGQTPCTDFIRAGASGSSGTVTEPYALQEKFPTPFLHLEYAKGFTLAESFYLSLTGPYQLLVVGDPMCKPWCPNVEMPLTGLTNGQSIDAKLDFKAGPPSDPGFSVAAYELYVDGRLKSTVSDGASFPLDPSSLSGGVHDVTVVAVGKAPSEPRIRVSKTVHVPGDGQSAVLTVDAAKVAFGSPVHAVAACPGAKSVEIRHLGRTMAKSQGERCAADLATTQTGFGTVVLVPVAIVAGPDGEDREVQGLPVTVQVDPAPEIAAQGSSSGMPSTRGLKLAIAGGGAHVVADTIDGNWLANLATGPDQQFVLDGLFQAPRADLYQVQIRTNTKATVQISGLKVLTAGTDKQQFAPAWLGAGIHRLRVSGTAPKGAVLDLRIGAQGCPRVSGGLFAVSGS